MKINRTKNSGYLEGETALHKLKAKTKITASLFLILGSGICNRWALMGVGLLSVMGVFVAEFQLKKLHLIGRVACFYIWFWCLPLQHMNG